MKKWCAIISMAIITGSAAYSQQTLSLKNAIDSAAKIMERETGPGKKAAVLNFIASSQELSTYIIDELTDVFINNKILEITERYRTDTILSERNYQTSGEVSDDEIISIGNQIGAQYIISGQLDYDGIAYRFRIYAIDIEKGVRITSSSVNIKNNDKQLNYFLGGNPPREHKRHGRDKTPTGENAKPVLFSLGAGVYSGLQFFKNEYKSARREYTNGEIAVFAGFETEFFSYVAFNASFLYINRGRLSGDEWGGARALNLRFSLLGKYPFYLNQNLAIYPLAGLAFDMPLYAKSKAFDTRWKRDYLKDEDSLWLPMGAGLDYRVTKNMKLNTKLCYNLFLYNKSAANADYDHYTRHGPDIMLGINYVF